MIKNYRRCISCRKLAHKNDFWRIVRTHPSYQIKLNQGMGRSAYLCPKSDCLQMAQKKNRLARSLKINVAKEFYIDLWQVLANNN